MVSPFFFVSLKLKWNIVDGSPGKHKMKNLKSLFLLSTLFSNDFVQVLIFIGILFFDGSCRLGELGRSEIQNPLFY